MRTGACAATAVVRVFPRPGEDRAPARLFRSTRGCRLVSRLLFLLIGIMTVCVRSPVCLQLVVAVFGLWGRGIVRGRSGEHVDRAPELSMQVLGFLCCTPVPISQRG